MAKPNKDRKGAVRSLIAPITPKTAGRVIKANTQLKFGDEGRGLQGDLRAGRQDARNTNAWFADYQNRMRGITSDQKRDSSNLQGQLRDNANYFGRQNSATDSAARAEEDRSAAIRGAVADPTAASRDAAAEDQRQALMASSRDRAALMGGSTRGMLRGVSAASELGRQADQRQIRNTQIETRSKIRNLNKDKGAFKLSEWDRLRSGERDFFIQNRAFREDQRNANANRALDWATENRIAREGRQGGASDRAGKREDRREARAERRAEIREGMAFIYNTLSTTKGADKRKWQKFFADENKLTNWLIAKERGLSLAAAKAAARRYQVQRGRQGVQGLVDIVGGRR